LTAHLFYPSTIANETIEVDDTKVKEALLYIEKENKEGITVEEDLDDVTTDTRDELDDVTIDTRDELDDVTIDTRDELDDYNSESSFDEELDGNEQDGDCDM
jgi:hypothetical protein